MTITSKKNISITKIKYSCLVFLFMLIISNSIKANNWVTGIELSYANISGFNAYEADQNYNIQSNKTLIVPSLFVTKKIGDKFSYTIKYSYFDKIITNGQSSDSDIFNVGGFALQTVAPYRIIEEIHEATFSMKYTLFNTNNWDVSAGPNIGIAHIGADFYHLFSYDGDIIVPDRSFRKFSETEFNLGAELSSSYQISNNTNLNFNYRFSKPSNKNIHLFGLSISYVF